MPSLTATGLEEPGKTAFWTRYECGAKLPRQSHRLDDRHAPDFAPTVDIHRKPGYDPVELFLDPAIRFPKFAVGWRLIKRKLGMRALMDVIPLDAALVRGSHGRADTPETRSPVVISSAVDTLPEGVCQATDVKQLMLDHIFGREAQGQNATAMRAVR